MLDYVERLTRTNDIHLAWKIHCEAMARFGFDRLLYACNRFGDQGLRGSPDDYLLLSNHPAGYLEGYIGRRLYLHAPFYKWALQNTGARSWGSIDPEEMTEGARAAVKFNHEFGIVAGYTISFPVYSPMTRALISMAAREGLSQAELDQLWERDGRTISAMCQVLHLTVLQLPYPVRRPLTARQREVLEWVGAGKTTQDIAQIMGLTATTVEKHLRLAREALGVDTTAQAVLKASLQNQIFQLSA